MWPFAPSLLRLVGLVMANSRDCSNTIDLIDLLVRAEDLQRKQ